MNRTALRLIPFLLAVAVGAAATDENPLPQGRIHGVLAANSSVVKVQGGFQRLEGPVTIHGWGLYFSDIDQNRTYKVDENETISVWREKTNAANGLYLMKDGRLLAAERGNPDPPSPGRIVAVLPNRRVTVIASEFQGKAFRGPNDLIPDGKGGIYFTDPGPAIAPNVAPGERRGAVYYIRPKGEVVLLDDQMVYPKGITLSLDERTLFVDDTFGQFVYAFDVQPDGQVRNKREFVKLQEPEQWPPWGLRSRADGMAIDSKGRLYVATASGVQVIDPKGEYLGTIRVPEIVRNLAFSGPWRQTLYMTALTALYRIDLLSQGPAKRAK
jgi:gluconolactonase